MHAGRTEMDPILGMQRFVALSLAWSLVAGYSGNMYLAAAEWPQFRGPGGQGQSESHDLPVTWSETENVSWRTAIPGRGFSSPVIEGDQIWLTTGFDVASSAAEIERRTRTNTGSEPLRVSDSASMHAICVDRETGALLHDVPLLDIEKPQWVHVENSYATPTPVIEDGRLYCHFGTFGTVCLETETQNILWKNQNHQVMHENGPASSPLIWNDSLIFHCDGSDRQFIAALDKNTGDFLWKTNRTGEMHANPQLKKSYGTPLVVDIGGREVIVSPAANWLYGYDPETGEELWKVPYDVLGFSIVPRPVSDEQAVYICTGYVGSQLLALSTDTPSGIPEIKWRFRKQVPFKSSPVLSGGRLYFVSDGGGVLTCLDTDRGEPVWRKRIMGKYSASPLAAPGKIYFFSDTGETTVIRPGDRFEQLGKNRLAGRIMASPAVAGNSLFVRTDEALYKIEEK